MISLRRLASGVLLSWIGTATSIIAGFVMAPLLIHHLGVVGYGVWILVQSAVSYLYLLDLGLRTAVIRFVARDYVSGNHSEVVRIVSAALWVRFWSGVAVVLIVTILTSCLSFLFPIPTQYLRHAQIALLLVGLSFASTLVFSVFSATLMAIGSYSLLASLDLLQTILIPIGIVPIVIAGHGIVGMALWSFAVVLTNSVAVTFVCYRRYPQLKGASFRVPERSLLKELWSVGFYYAGYNLADQLIAYSDNLVVASFVSTPGVAYFAIAGRMVQYVKQIAIAMIKFFMPLASGFDARKQFHRLQQLQIKGTQVVLLVTLPIIITMFMRGGTFFRLWLGADFEATATPILRVLMLATAVMMTNAGANGLTVAMGKQRWLALFAIIEGIANITLSIILAKSMGLIGVALGTAVPLVVMHILVWPSFMCKLLRISQYRFFLEIWLRPGLALAPFMIVSYAAETHWHAYNLWLFFGQTLAVVPVAVVGALLVFRAEMPQLLKYADIRARAPRMEVNDAANNLQ